MVDEMVSTWKQWDYWREQSEGRSRQTRTPGKVSRVDRTVVFVSRVSHGRLLAWTLLMYSTYLFKR